MNGRTCPDRLHDDEPEVEVSIPKSPKHLTRREKYKFRQTAKLLAGMRVMSESDVDALARYAVRRFSKVSVRFREESGRSDRQKMGGIWFRFRPKLLKNSVLKSATISFCILKPLP